MASVFQSLGEKLWRFRAVSKGNHAHYAFSRGEAARLAVNFGLNRVTSCPRAVSGPSPRTARRSGADDEERLTTGPGSEEVGIEHQLQITRRFRLGLPVLKLQEFGAWDELRSGRFRRDSLRSVRRRPRAGVGEERTFPQFTMPEDPLHHSQLAVGWTNRHQTKARAIAGGVHDLWHYPRIDAL